MLDRRAFMAYSSAMGISSTVFPGALYARTAEKSAPGGVAPEDITAEDVAHAADLAGLDFTEEEREMMVEDLRGNLEGYEAVRALDLPNDVPPALVFDPRLSGVRPPESAPPMQWTPQPVERPASEEDLAFMPVAGLAYLLKNQEVTSTELTRLCLRRLKKYDGVLKAVVTLTEERALQQAKQADEEIAAGDWRGPLHGVPYGAKDLLAVEGYPTTWGATPYQEQAISENAAVVERLGEAGAVLVAKLSLGALAWGDVWFGGTTKNPWNVEQGSSGSSAGPGSAVAAGLVPFAIGSETLGSIVSPSTRNGVTGHRPTFGAVSRHGAMALSWSMDKLGPMTRSAEDCALVFEAINGADPRDPATTPVPFPYQQGFDVTGLRVGFLEGAFAEDYDNQSADQKTLGVLRDLGVTLEPMALPSNFPLGAMLNTLSVEAATAFDALTRERGIDEMVRQTTDAWPHVFRTARFVPGVELLQANRARTLLMRETAAAMDGFDVIVSPSFGGGTLQITNLTGHPAVSLPNAFRRVEGEPPSSPRRQPGSITFVGGLYRDAAMLSLARAYQEATDFHRRRPPIA